MTFGEAPINEAAVDRFTLLHLLSGAGLRFVGVPLVVSTVGSLTFEIAENLLQPHFTSIFPNTADRDSPMNSACDTLAVMLGWGIANWVTETRKRGRMARTWRGLARRRT